MTPHLFDPSLLVIFVIACTLAYLAGSISAAVLVCRFAGLPDPRTAGSNNPGATNVLRVGGKGPAALTLLGDALKGYLPVLLAGSVAGVLAGPAEGARIAAIVALAAFLGHLYPVFFDFRGGKGVATAFGALLALNATAGLLAILAWLAMSLAFRRSSLAALVTFTLVPALLMIENERAGAIVFVLVAALLFWTHRANIRRLLDGTEPTIGKRGGAAKTGKAKVGSTKAGDARPRAAQVGDAKRSNAGDSKPVGTNTGPPAREAGPIRAGAKDAGETGTVAPPPRRPATKRPKPAAKRKAKKKARKKSRGR